MLILTPIFDTCEQTGQVHIVIIAILTGIRIATEAVITNIKTFTVTD